MEMIYPLTRHSTECSKGQALHRNLSDAVTLKYADIDIRVRSPRHEHILREEWKTAQAEGINLYKVDFDKVSGEMKL